MIFIQVSFESFYVYAAVEPTTGERFFLELPALNAQNFQIVLNAFSHAYSESLHIVALENLHTTQSLRIPDHIGLIFLPPLCARTESTRAALARYERPSGPGHANHAR